MSGIAVGSLGLFAFHHDPGNTDNRFFNYPQYLLLLVADMLWSGIDMGAQLYKEINPDAQRFSLSLQKRQLMVSITIPLSNRTYQYVQNVSQCKNP